MKKKSVGGNTTDLHGVKSLYSRANHSNLNSQKRLNIAKIIPGGGTCTGSADESSVRDGTAHPPTEYDIELSRRIKSIEEPDDDNFVPFTLTTNILKTKRYQLPESALSKIEKYRYTLSPKDAKGEELIKYKGTAGILLEEKEIARQQGTEPFGR